MRAKGLIVGLTAVMVLCLALVGCKKNEMQEPDGMEQWRIMAEQSKGHSPEPQEELTEKDMDRLTVDKPEFLVERERQNARALPKFSVSLRMHNANLISVIQALARAAGQSIVVSPNVTGNVNINIVDMPWDQVFRGVLSSNRLSYSWEGDILRVLTSEDLESDLQFEVLRKKRQFERLQLEKLEPLSTAVIKIKYSDAENLKEALEKFLTQSGENKTLGSIEVDKYTNSLMVQAISSDLRKIIKLVSRLDSPRKQIRLKAFIVETTTDAARALGIQWGGKYSGRIGDGNDITLFPGDTTRGSDTDSDDTSSSGEGYGISFLPDSSIYDSSNGMALGVMLGKIGGNVLEMQLHALEKESLAKIISSPSITTMDNQKAYTESGDRIPYQSTSGDDGTTIEYEDAVLRLEITPHIVDDKYLKLQVLVKKDSIGTQKVGDNPVISKKTTETTLITRDGETVVISGLNKDTTQKSKEGVPYLKDIPGLSWAFGSKTRSGALEEFLIFITPEVLDVWKPGERQKSMEEIQQEVQDIWGQDKAEAEGGDNAAAHAVDVSEPNAN